jgi:hypothetical protein
MFAASTVGTPVGTEGVFDLEDRLHNLSAVGDPLATLGRSALWEDFRQMPQ